MVQKCDVAYEVLVGYFTIVDGPALIFLFSSTELCILQGGTLLTNEGV